ncbi:MAG: aldose epimerase [Verrucomicrobia bacterium]|nr:aldose epimerase [Verrucomicrobiota bacterium]
MEKVSYQGQELTRWRVGNSTFLALPERGARLMNWNVTLGDGSVRDVIYWPEQADFADIAKVRGGNPILFPFNGRSFDRGDIFHWRAADGVRRPMPLHGIARQGDFKVLHADVRGFSAQFVPGAEARNCYPFDYEFTVTYRFESLGLSCEFAVTNLGQEPLPWCAGHHFYFTLPWSEGTTRADYLIRIPATKRLRHDPTGALVAGPALQAEESFANPALVDVLHTGLRSNEVVFGEKGRPGDVCVRLGSDKVPASDAMFVTWTLADDSPFYCVEPWMGPPNAPGHGVGLKFVQPRETQRFVVSVHLR